MADSQGATSDVFFCLHDFPIGCCLGSVVQSLLCPLTTKITPTRTSVDSAQTVKTRSERP
jgi:hypothetical protein